MFPSASGLSRGYSGIHSKKRSQMAAALSFPYCPKICIGDWPLGKRVCYPDQSLLATAVTHPILLAFKFSSDLNNATSRNSVHQTPTPTLTFLSWCIRIICTEFRHSIICTLPNSCINNIIQDKYIF